MINVTKSYLPPMEEYTKYLEEIWKSHYLTNNGPLLKELDKKLREYLKVENLHIVNNGTSALQLALNALDITEGEVLTTPFSFAATTTSIMWERCKPVFVDIETDNFGMDISKIEEKITPNTKAIMAVYVFGYPSHLEELEQIAKKHNLKLIIDAAHAFGEFYKDKSIFSYGDITTCSFHATKVFHTVEGGACIVNCGEEVNHKLDVIKKFGFNYDDYEFVGINAKNSEFHAAMGLAVLPHIDEIIEARKKVSELYDELLENKLGRPKKVEGLKYNYAYYPIIFNNENELLETFDSLHEIDVYPRRYFYPSLNTLPYLDEYQECPVSEDISKRIACLPLDPYLEETDVKKICKVIRKTIKR